MRKCPHRQHGSVNGCQTCTPSILEKRAAAGLQSSLRPKLEDSEGSSHKRLSAIPEEEYESAAPTAQKSQNLPRASLQGGQTRTKSAPARFTGSIPIDFYGAPRDSRRFLLPFLISC
ncbi:hypothetical protein VPH35_061376 [Triticum aestivum]